jgi:hypothetical protein
MISASTSTNAGDGAGAAATSPAPTPAAAVAEALHPRGAEAAGWRSDGIELLVRAAMPAVYYVDDRVLVLDGHAAPSTIANGYAERGPSAMVAGPDPYAVILADPAAGTLVMARHGDGPPLYWVRHDGAVLAASEPAALLAAGVPREPDPAVVDRFLATGGCDEGTETFLAGVRRVLPGQVIEVVRDAGAFAIQVHDAAGPLPRRAPLYPEFREEGSPPGSNPLPAGRVGMRLSHGEASGAALLDAARATDRPHPLPAYSTSFPELAVAAPGSLASPDLRHRALPFFTDQVDVDAYLAGVGEPTPYLDDWLLWAVSRRVAGEIDTLVDGATGAHLSRLADRVASRFGVQLYQPAAWRSAEGSTAGQGLLAELLRRMRVELVTTFLHPRYPGGGRRTGLGDLMALLAGEHTDPSALWRRYLVERWLRCVVAPVAAPVPAPVPMPVTVDGVRWTRRPLRTEALAAGDKIPERIAWYVAEDPPAPAGRWYVVVAAKAVAVMQGRARNLWDIRPGLTARVLSRLAGRRCGLAPAPAVPWAMQVAIDEGGWWRMATAAAGAALTRTNDWYARVAGPAVGAIRGPREDAVPPGHVSVIPAPAEPNLVAAEVVVALRAALPEDSYATLGGCAVVSRDLLGWAGAPAGAPPPAALLAALCADDPFGDDHTPIVIAAATGETEQAVRVRNEGDN